MSTTLLDVFTRVVGALSAVVCVSTASAAQDRHPESWEACEHCYAVGVAPELSEYLQVAGEGGEAVSLEALLEGLRYHVRGRPAEPARLIAARYEDGRLAEWGEAPMPEGFSDPDGETIIMVSQLDDRVGSSHRRIIPVAFGPAVAEGESGLAFRPGLRSVGIDPGMLWVAAEPFADGRPPESLEDAVAGDRPDAVEGTVGLLVIVGEPGATSPVLDDTDIVHDTGRIGAAFAVTAE